MLFVYSIPLYFIFANNFIVLIFDFMLLYKSNLISINLYQ
nr:MAG TPA: hypothetical protein [Caudoviricetes sp.]